MTPWVGGLGGLGDHKVVAQHMFAPGVQWHVFCVTCSGRLRSFMSLGSGALPSAVPLAVAAFSRSSTQWLLNPGLRSIPAGARSGRLCPAPPPPPCGLEGPCLQEVRGGRACE